MKSIAPEDKEWIRRLLREGNTCQYIADEWEVDVSHVYRNLAVWRMDYRGRDLPRGYLTQRQQQVYDYMEMRQFELTKQDVLDALKTSRETIDLVLKIKRKKLTGRAKILEKEMLAKVMLAKFYLKEGLRRSVAISKAGLNINQYKHWLSRLNAEHKKAANK
jgi:hypothetical protein